MTKIINRYQKPDFVFMFVTFLLLGFGITMVFSSSYYIAYTTLNDPHFFFRKQLICAGIGLILFFVFSNINYTRYMKHSRVIILVSLLLLLLLFVPGLALKVKGATRWLNLGAVSFQPSEVVKIAMIIYTASMMTRKQDQLNSFFKGVLPPLIIIGMVCALILAQPHYSATIIIIVTCINIMFCAGVKLRHLISIGAIGIPSLIGVLYLADYRIDRLKTIFDTSDNFMNEKYQVMHSLFAIGPGGLTGVGLGKSVQKMLYLPEAHNDFIFAIIAEELGFIGSLALILLFAALIIKGLSISLRAPDYFGMLLGIGITTLFATEVLLNLGVVTNLLPVTGVPLPLISCGGTALIIKLSTLGILLNISKHRT